MQTSADAKIWNKIDSDSNSDFRINLDPDVRRIPFQIVDTFVGVIHFAKFGSNRLLIVWELRKHRNANKCRKIDYSSVVKKMKIRNPRADPDHHQKSTTSRGSSLARACQDWSTSVSAFVSVLSCLPPLIRQVASDSTSTQYCRRSALYKLLCIYDRTNKKGQRTIT